MTIQYADFPPTIQQSIRDIATALDTIAQEFARRGKRDSAVEATIESVARLKEEFLAANATPNPSPLDNPRLRGSILWDWINTPSRDGRIAGIVEKQQFGVSVTVRISSHYFVQEAYWKNEIRSIAPVQTEGVIRTNHGVLDDWDCHALVRTHEAAVASASAEALQKLRAT